MPTRLSRWVIHSPHALTSTQLLFHRMTGLSWNSSKEFANFNTFMRMIKKLLERLPGPEEQHETRKRCSLFSTPPNRNNFAGMIGPIARQKNWPNQIKYRGWKWHTFSQIILNVHSPLPNEASLGQINTVLMVWTWTAQEHIVSRDFIPVSRSARANINRPAFISSQLRRAEHHGL